MLRGSNRKVQLMVPTHKNQLKVLPNLIKQNPMLTQYQESMSQVLIRHQEITTLTQGEPQIHLMRHMIQGEHLAPEEYFLMPENRPKITLLI